MGMFKEFKEFAMKGSIVELAVAVVIGVAFGAIVGAVVDHIIMPLIGILTGGINFDSLIFKVGSAEVKYGMAISAIVKFIAITLFLFVVIKAITAASKKEVPSPPSATPEDIVLLREIRDALIK